MVTEAMPAAFRAKPKPIGVVGRTPADAAAALTSANVAVGRCFRNETNHARSPVAATGDGATGVAARGVAATDVGAASARSDGDGDGDGAGAGAGADIVGAELGVAAGVGAHVAAAASVDACSGWIGEPVPMRRASSYSRRPTV